LEIAGRAGIGVDFVLLDHRWMFTGVRDTIVDEATGGLLEARMPHGRANVLLTPGGRDALFENVVTPLVHRYSDRGERADLASHILAYEFMNEPDFVIEEWERDLSPHVTRPLPFSVLAEMISRLSADERAQVPDVGRSASLLADRVQALAYSLADLDRSSGSQTAISLEAEITKLEADANPLDVQASETRVKRLAFLKRQRRGLVDVLERRKQIAGKLETCASALASMKLDLNRLSFGSQSFQNITSLANEAMTLARSVDHVLSAADEVGRLTDNRAQSRAI
jgi:hypothetical protein